MNTTPSPEIKTWRHLARAIAACLENPQCPRELAEALLEAVDPLCQLVTPETPNAHSVLLLRALANGGIGNPRPTIEKRNGRKSRANLTPINGRCQALAASAIH